MIPDFEKDGNLPAGIHEATLEEFKARFAHTAWRKQLFNKLLRLIEDLKTIGCKTVYIDGSYVTTKRIPGDYDACWDNQNTDLTKLASLPGFNPKNRVTQKSLYGGDIFPAFLIEGGSMMLFIDFFQHDKATGLKKGIIKLKL